MTNTCMNGQSGKDSHGGVPLLHGTGRVYVDPETGFIYPSVEQWTTGCEKWSVTLTF